MLLAGVSQCCVLEQDTLSAAKCWFNPGRKFVDWDIKNQNEHVLFPFFKKLR